MYIVGLDQSWLQYHFLLHLRRIDRHAEIARVQAYGVRRVTIDPARGLDLSETSPRPAEAVSKGESVPQASEKPLPQREGATLNCAPSTDAVAGNGAPLNR